MKPYESLTRQEKRVAIAADVLKQLKIGRIVAARGTYGPLSKERRANFYASGSNETCTACGIGSMVITATLMSGCKIFQGSYSHDSVSKFLEVFDEEEVDEIEAAFEMWDDEPMWTDNIEDPQQRLAAMIQSIVDSGGNVSFRGEKP